MCYKTISKSKFEYELIRIKNENGLCGWSEVSEELAKEGDGCIFEYVYSFKTNIKGLELIIYSSINIFDNISRGYGSDAVRVVQRWKTKNGILYRKVRKLLRVESLFTNLEKAILDNVVIEQDELYGSWTEGLVC